MADDKRQVSIDVLNGVPRQHVVVEMHIEGPKGQTEGLSPCWSDKAVGRAAR